MKIETASVKVMRSHDYCHFEVNLTTTVASATSDYRQLETVDNLRKEAARLADKAVEQYKIAKESANNRIFAQNEIERSVARATSIRTLPESDRTPEQKAELKAYDDAVWRSNREYDYEDNWDN